MHSHLVAFEYGSGAVWGYVNAPSRSEIETRIPEVDVFDDPPSWMTDDEVDALRSRAVDVDERNALDSLLRTRA